jgi:hypothetical protein
LRLATLTFGSPEALRSAGNDELQLGLTHIGAALADGQKFVSGLTRGSAAVKAEFKAPGFIDSTGANSAQIRG